MTRIIPPMPMSYEAWLDENAEQETEVAKEVYKAEKAYAYTDMDEFVEDYLEAKHNEYVYNFNEAMVDKYCV